MNAYELLDKGLKYGDWELIAAAKAQLQQGAQVMESPPIEISQNITTQPKPLSLPEPSALSDGDPTSPFRMQIRNIQQRRNREDGGVYTRTESIDTEKIKAFNMFDDNEQISPTKPKDKELYQNSPPIPRRPPAKTISVQCVGGCGRFFNVSPIHAPKVGGERRYYCDDCIKAKGTYKRNE